MTRPKLPQNPMLQEFKKYEGFPNKTREQRKLIRKSNPLYYTFGDVRPVWKSWMSYMQNMELLEPNYEDNQTLPQTEQA